ncbi:fluoride efflux transporter FluC [Allobacillus sp. GCM10007491]|uniref:Fluoride-specific ion channel FluC n=1 Tax=Allobacillus saliphilus TaxID=2912308 RepID=A0A941HTP8_9BACI|nr:CrcB family protein [Allobacillus saliphilus]MBR7554050.1 CrcB family protein [Allobacillus saliphilus]
MKLHYLLAVGLGGAVGSSFRYMVGRLLTDTPAIATLSVNILGSFLLGVITAYFIRHPEKHTFQLLLGTGFCGGFTTMSTVALDFFRFIDSAQYIYLAAYSSATLIGGILAALIGFKWMEKKVTK